MIAVRPCDDWAEAVSAFADGEAAPGEEGAVREHLAGCEGCAQWLALVRADREAYLGAYGVAVPSNDYVRAVVDRLPKREAKPQTSRGFRWVELAVGLAITAILAALFFPVFARSRDKARETSCESNLKQLVLGVRSREKARQASCQSNLKLLMLGLQMYAQDYGDRLPSAANWQSAVMPYVRNVLLLKCPLDASRTKCSYAMPFSMSGAKLGDLSHPDLQPVLYDADAQGRWAPRHNDGGDVAFADGHVKWMAQPPPGIQSGGSLGALDRNYGLAEQLHIAYDANVELETKTVGDAVDQARRVIGEQQGFVLNAQYADRNGRTTAQLTFKVPSTQLDLTLQALCRLGRPLSWQVKGEDLTAQVTSAQSRVRLDEADLSRAQERAQNAPRTSEREAAQAVVRPYEEHATEARTALYGQQSQTVLSTVSAAFSSPALRVTPWLATRKTFAVAWGWSARIGGTGVAWLLGLAPVWLPLLVLAWAARHVRSRRRAASVG